MRRLCGPSFPGLAGSHCNIVSSCTESSLQGKIAISSDAAESNLCTHQAECFQCSHTFYHYQYWMKYFFKTTQSINCVQKCRDVLYINCFDTQFERSGNCCFYSNLYKTDDYIHLNSIINEMIIRSHTSCWSMILLWHLLIVSVCHPASYYKISILYQSTCPLYFYMK